MGAPNGHFDYLIIGGGSGGMATARRAAGYGAKVGLIEGAPMGGTCVNVGCVPKKVMFNAANVAELIHESKNFGFSVGGLRFDWNHLKEARDAYIKRLNGIYVKNLANSGVAILEGFGSFVDPHTVAVGDQTFTADNFCIAVGGKPVRPRLEGVEHCITSNEFFTLTTQPKSVLVIGGGYIGVELAGVFNSLGTKTTVMTKGSSVLTSFDKMLQEKLLGFMQTQGIEYQPNHTPQKVIKHPDGTVSLVTAAGVTFGPYDQILLATGRSPNVDRLGLDKAAVQTNAQKFITVDEYQRTSTKHIHAIGDVCGQVQLTPMAIAAGRRLADRLFGGMADAKADYSNVPTVVFSHPPIGTVGISEEEAVSQYGADKVKVYTSTFVNLHYGTYAVPPEQKPKTHMKLVTLLPHEKILGIHMIGMGVDEALQGFAVALKMGATKADLDSCVALHPTAAEELVTLAPWGMSPAPVSRG
eukprot:gene28286-34154_t